MTLTHHAQQRSRQRGIGAEEIQIAIDYGRHFHSWGDCVVLDDRSLIGTPYQHRAQELRGLCVVFGGDGCVRTVMWLHRLRRRPGLLGRAQLQRRHCKKRS